MPYTRARAAGFVLLGLTLGAGCAAGGGGDARGAGGGIAGGCTRASDCEVLAGPCRAAACINGSCEAVPASELGACDDGLFCTIDDSCRGGVCVGGASRGCASPDDCHIGVCDEAAGACTSMVGNEGATCDTGDLCAAGGACSNGACVGAVAVDCTALDGPCTKGICDPAKGCVAIPANDGGACGEAKAEDCKAGRCAGGQCEVVAANEGKPCDDGSFCTLGEFCQAGVCGAGGPRPCAAPSACWTATCDEAADICVASPGNEGAACDDGDPCRAETKCANGACIGGVAANEGAACDDGLACTTGEVCAAGVCVTATGPRVYFREDFSSNERGWLLGPEWAIGPAKESSGDAFGADPGLDHTSTADNGVAGVVIGGAASTVAHPFHWLESPAFDTSGAEGTVVFGFHRWLNSDFAPHMDNAIEVWDGAAWVRLWSSGPPPRVQDSPVVGKGWTYLQHDVTAYKNAAMRVRFGVSVGGMSLKVGSWNVDDVVVADQACP
ncbi:hypothetical protein [Polyangium spumosum]|uniref:MAM domain-containing protein n=1 Tax=Polyangium spumosum TaxID=889282 RepID=A0A6N7PQI4_9BACT|nr:hypothetical protein [Polyangium spumosum]MRG92364.1 hypothetical protein [Polyangium spumosum]